MRSRVFGVNYFSRSTTIILPASDNYKLANQHSSPTLILTGAEDKALQGCNLSADSGARPGREAAFAAVPPVLI